MEEIAVKQVFFRLPIHAFVAKSSDILVIEIILVIVMVALCNRADHYIFILFLLLLSSFFFFFFSSPNLSGRKLDVYHTLAHDVALVRI